MSPHVCQHERTISVSNGLSDTRRCIDCGQTMSGRELAALQDAERMRGDLERVASDVAGWSESKRANAEAIMYPKNRLGNGSESE